MFNFYRYTCNDKQLQTSQKNKKRKEWKNLRKKSISKGSKKDEELLKDEDR